MFKKPEPKGTNYTIVTKGRPIKSNEITIRRLIIDGEDRDCYVFKHNGNRYVQVVEDRRIGLSQEVEYNIKKGKPKRIYKPIEQYTKEELEKMEKEELVAILNRHLPTERYVPKDKRKEMIDRILKLGIQRRRRNQIKHLSKEELEKFLKFKGFYLLDKQHGFTTKKHYLDLLETDEHLRKNYFQFRQTQARAKNVENRYRYLIWMLSDGSIMTQKQIEERFGYETFKHAYSRGYIKENFNYPYKTLHYSLGDTGQKLFNANPNAFENLKSPSPPKVMEKKFSDDLMKSFKELAKNKREYAIGLDFERELQNPQRIVAIQGAESFTFHIGKDFEMFGHTHPNQTYPHPSKNDLLNLKCGKPEFIVAGRTKGNVKYKFKAIIMELLDEQKYRKWKKEPYSPTWLNLGDKADRDKFFDVTGVRIHPYRKDMKIWLVDDPKLEKSFPFFSKDDLEKISTGRLN